MLWCESGCKVMHTGVNMIEVGLLYYSIHSNIQVIVQPILPMHAGVTEMSLINISLQFWMFSWCLSGAGWRNNRRAHSRQVVGVGASSDSPWCCFPAGCSPTCHPWDLVVTKLRMEMCWCMPARKSQPKYSVPKATQAWQVRNWMKLQNSAGERGGEGVISTSLSHCLVSEGC